MNKRKLIVQQLTVIDDKLLQLKTEQESLLIERHNYYNLVANSDVSYCSQMTGTATIFLPIE